MTDVHDDHVLGFQRLATALIHGLPRRQCDPELINPRAYLRTRQIARPKTLATKTFSPRLLLFPVGRIHQNLAPSSNQPRQPLSIQNSKLKKIQAGKVDYTPKLTHLPIAEALVVLHDVVFLSPPPRRHAASMTRHSFLSTLPPPPHSRLNSVTNCNKTLCRIPSLHQFRHPPHEESSHTLLLIASRVSARCRTSFAAALLLFYYDLDTLSSEHSHGR